MKITSFLYKLLLIPSFLIFSLVDVHAESCASPYSINIPDTKTGTLDESGNQYDYYVFTAPSDGLVSIYTTGFTGDMDAFLYDTNCDSSGISDTSGASNIALSVNVTSGDTYVLELKAYSGNSDYTLYISTTTATTTTWIKNASGTSASTDPTPYLDDSDATETLTITGATELDVTITGTLENETDCGYDYVRITDSANVQSVKYCGNIDETYTATGPTVTLDFHSDGGVVAQGATVTIANATAPANICTGTHGLTGVYYNNDSFTNPVAMTRVDNDINFEWGSGSPTGINNDHFSITWAGTIYIPEDATYTFSAAHDDTMKVIIDGATIYDGTGWTHGQDTYVDATPVALTAGTYQINITFVEWTGGAYAKLAWRNDASITGRIIIPSSDFCTTPPAIPVVAVADNFTTALNTTLTENVLTNDTGVGKSVISNTQPSNGSVTMQSDGSIVYIPNTGYSGSDSFEYTISDGVTTDTTTVTILISNDTDFDEGVQPFVLINPPSTRNVIGDYVILGNTIECITEKRGTSGESNSYDGTCQDGNGYNDNNYMAKYLNIDGDSGIGAATWNASSSNFTLPTIYDQQGGDGILWVGIFWQGSINNADSYKQRRAYVDGSAYSYKYITSDEDIDLEDTDGNKLLLRIDDDTSYTPIQATTFYYDKSHGDKGGYYAAYTDVTQLFRSRNLEAGDHTVTVANITANEGRQQGTGNYAGWSMVVIYKEDDLNGEPRNISIYNGYTIIPNSREVEISGFKLPKTGTVNAKFGAFAGEGEYVYGAQSSKYDRMVMKRLSSDSGDAMPGAVDPDNIFDAILSGIDRDSANDNDVVNANGIDVESYNVSSLITAYRDLDPDIDTVYIGLSSNQDYITPSMMAFSTELYKPGLCYDYTFDIAGYVLESVNNDVNTSYHHFIPTLTSHVSIRSLEGDFTLNNARFSVLTDPEYMSYQSGSAAIAPNLIYGYTNVPVYNIDTPQASNFTMDIGDNIFSGSGGSIEAYQTTYTRFNHDMNLSKAIINTTMNMKVTYTVNYGSGPVPQAQLLDQAARCTGSGAYTPVFGKFNIVGDSAASDAYNLVSQVSSRPYNVRAYGYETDNTTVKSFNTAIEVEIFNANFFENDTTLSCHNPDSNVTTPMFIQFNNTASVDITAQQYNVAKRNAGYRVWYLEKSDGSVVEHHCADRSQETCFQAVYAADYPSDTLCSTDCSSGGSGCYTCLRKYYGKPVCSRDNFSIRPETFEITLKDGGTTIGLNNSATTYNIAAGYNYGLDIKALAYGTTNPALGYVSGFGAQAPYSTAPGNNAAAMGFGGLGTCPNQNNEDFGFIFWNGSASNGAVSTKDVGPYDFSINDSSWTAVDQVAGNLGCAAGSSAIPATGQVGCDISSDYTSASGVVYTDLPLVSKPFLFNASALNYTTNGAANTNFVYSNTVATNPVGGNPNLDPAMSLTFAGLVSAQGQGNIPLLNYTNNCYAQNIDLTYQGVSAPFVPTTVNGVVLGQRWFERLASDPAGAGIGTSDLVVNNPTILQTINFTPALQGAVQVELHINYDRASNDPHDPFSLTSTALNTVCSIPANCTSNASGVANYSPIGNDAFGNVATVLYSRVNAPRKRVMCNNSSGSCVGEMSYFYEFYASQAADQNPATRALITALLPNATRQRSLDGVNWYRNSQHTIADGVVNATTQSPRYTVLGPLVTNNGVTTRAYTYSGTRGYPYKDTINVTANAGVEPWLIYDPYIPNATRTSGALEFYGPGSWKSSGGQKSSTGVQKKTNRRIRW